MIGKWGSWIALGVVLVAALMIGTVASAAAVPPATTYSVSFTESGLPSGTSWTVTFNSVAHPGTTSTITVTGVAAGSYYYSVSNDIGGKVNVQYATITSAAYLSVPYEDKVAVVYATQYYVTFTVAPTSAGSAIPGSNWYNAYTNLSISGSAAVGYSWSDWTVSNASLLVLSSSALESTRLQINHPGTVGAHFATSKYTASFSESGLPASTPWSVILNGVKSSGTSATLDLHIQYRGQRPLDRRSCRRGQRHPVHALAVDRLHEHPLPAEPGDRLRQAVSGHDLGEPGRAGSTTPSGAAYYTSGSSFPLLATPSSSYIFKAWTVNETRVGLGSRALAGTNATVKASGDVIADFVAGTPCTTCTLTFHEIGLPANTAWGVYVNGYYHPTGSTSLVLTGLTTALSWSAFSPVGVGQYDVAYYPVGTASSYWPLGSTNSIQVVYEKYDYVTFQNNPYFGSGSATISSGWYVDGSVNALSAIASSTNNFNSWSPSSSNVTLGSTSSASTTMKVTGPGVVTENFISPHVTLHFLEYGLPSGSSWGIAVNGVPYFSSTPWLNISGSNYGGYSGSAYTNNYGVAGTQWEATSTSFSFTAPYQTYLATVFAKVVYVTFTTVGSGSTSPSGSTWYFVGTVLPILGENVTGSSFKAWSQTTGTATIGSTTSSGTTATIKGPGTITATFT